MATGKSVNWVFSQQMIKESPSRNDGLDSDTELRYRQHAANLIQDIGKYISVNQLTINSAIVYMHRFYMYHSFNQFSYTAVAPAAIFLAAKVEEQPRKMHEVIQKCYALLHSTKPDLDSSSEAYMTLAEELNNNELVILQTLGFDVTVEHPHVHVIKCTELIRVNRNVAEMAYFMASNSLHLTTFCLRYKPTVIAAMCICLSLKWFALEIPVSSDGKAYWFYMDPSITKELMNSMITEYLEVYEKFPTRLRKIKCLPAQKKYTKEIAATCSSNASQSSPVASQSGAQQTSANSKAPSQIQKRIITLDEYKLRKRTSTTSETEVECIQQPEEQPKSENKFKELDRVQVVKLYKNNPTKLRHYLKCKAQIYPLRVEERMLYARIKAKEEMRKRKEAEEKATNENKREGQTASSESSSNSAAISSRKRCNDDQEDYFNASKRLKIDT